MKQIALAAMLAISLDSVANAQAAPIPDPATISVPDLSGSEDPAIVSNGWKYFFFQRDGVSFAEAYEDFADCRRFLQPNSWATVGLKRFVPWNGAPGKKSEYIASSYGLVGALIRMQSSMTTDQVAIDALQETQMRINAIASVHRRLYTNRQVGTVQIDEYLGSLLTELEASMRDDKRPHRVVLAAKPVNLATDKVITLGLIVSELVTNAFKYAYGDGIEGEVRVIIDQTDDLLRVIVEDDGAGFDHAGPAKGTGLGTKILTAMAASLKSELGYDREHRGTRATLVFSIG